MHKIKCAMDEAHLIVASEDGASEALLTKTLKLVMPYLDKGLHQLFIAIVHVFFLILR